MRLCLCLNFQVRLVRQLRSPARSANEKSTRRQQSSHTWALEKVAHAIATDSISKKWYVRSQPIPNAIEVASQIHWKACYQCVFEFVCAVVCVQLPNALCVVSHALFDLFLRSFSFLVNLQSKNATNLTKCIWKLKFKQRSDYCQHNRFHTACVHRKYKPHEDVQDLRQMRRFGGDRRISSCVWKISKNGRKYFCWFHLKDHWTTHFATTKQPTSSFSVVSQAPFRFVWHFGVCSCSCAFLCSIPAEHCNHNMVPTTTTA